MKILVISQYYYPEQFRINDICKELANRGHEVTVLTGLPNYPEGEIFKGYETKYKEIDYYENVRIIRCKIRPRHKGGLNLLRNYISYAVEATKKVKKLKYKFDLIYAYQMSPVSLVIPAIQLKRATGLPVFVYCCDLWPESVRDSVDSEAMSLKHPVYIIAKFLSKIIYSQADMIGVKCEEFTEYLNRVCFVDRKRTCLIYEHAEECYLTIPEEPEDNNCYDYMFLGNIGKAQNCDYIIKAIQLLKTEKPFKMHFVGSGSELENLRRYVLNNGLSEKVIFHGRYPVSEINKFYELADCCLLTLSSKTATGLTPPAKLAGYMAASRPIIAAAEGATRVILEDGKCGICVHSEDINGLAQAMQYAIDHQNEFKAKGKNGRLFFLKNFTLNKHVDELEKQFKRLLMSKS